MFLHQLSDLEFTINIKVKTRAKSDSIKGIFIIDEKEYLLVNTKTIPHNNKANKSIIKILSKAFNIKQANMEIIKGHISAYKTILINNIDFNTLKNKLQHYI